MDYKDKVVRTHSVLAPRWWEFRRRFKWWRLDRNLAKTQAELTTKERELSDELERKLEREFVFGSERFAGWTKPVSPPRDEDRPHGGPR